MDISIKKFSELCARSRHGGLTIYEHQEKKELADRLVENGIMTNNGVYNFVDPENTKYFVDTIKNWNNK